jgi:hypothetical protein
VRWIEIIAGAALFLVTAKLHGRQLRLEREQAGIREVSFGRGAKNDPFVVALWRRERYIFWPAAAATAVALYFTSLAWPLAYIFVPGIVGFVLGGALSFARTRAARRRAG